MSYYPQTARNRDLQDGTERHVFGEQEYVDGAGSVVRVRGTGTEDQEATVLNTGYSFNLDKDSDAEVILLAGGSDTNMKFALLTLPHDKQRKWKAGRGGVQNPLNADHALEFKNGKVHLTKGEFAIGESGILEVKDGIVYIRGDLVVAGTITANNQVVTPTVTSGVQSVPGFDAS